MSNALASSRRLQVLVLLRKGVERLSYGDRRGDRHPRHGQLVLGHVDRRSKRRMVEQATTAIASDDVAFGRAGRPRRPAPRL